MLYFVASVEALAEEQRRLLSAQLPIDDVAREVFLHVGPDCLKPPQRRDRFKPKHLSVRDWCKITGDRANSQEATDGFYDFTGGSDRNRDCRTITAGVGEALLNAKNHAYAKDGNRGWWLFYEKQGGRLTVCVCDLGVGIRSTVRNSLRAGDYARRILNVLALKKPLRSDSYFIELALEDRRSATMEKGRGQGLQDIERVVKHDPLPGASLTIMSGRGLVVRCRDEANSSSRDFAIAIPGTIVQWQLALPPKAIP